MNGQNGTSSTPLLLALVATGGLTLALVTYLLAKGGEDALASSAVIVAFAATIIGPLVVVLQTRALQAQVTAQVKHQAAVTREQVAAVKQDVAVLTVQTDGKLSALVEAVAGKASAEGQIAGAALARSTAATELEARATAASLLVTESQSRAPGESPPVPVVVTNAVPVPVRETPNKPPGG